MSGVEIACVAAAMLALVLGSLLLAQVRANRRRTTELEARIATLARQVETTPPPIAAQPQVHMLEPIEPAGGELPAVVRPTTAQVVDATLGRPLVRAATLSHGLRRALRPESRDRIAALVRREFRRRRKLRMKASRRAARLAVVPPPPPADRGRAS